MKTNRSGLTVIEILVVVGIIALLVGMLLPAVHTVQKMAKETKQRAQFTAIELGLAAFRNDYGDYPPSDWLNSTSPPTVPGNYCGAQKLAEALLGWDLLGFHPDSAWRADGLDRADGPTTYAPPDPGPASLDKRRDRYIELGTANVFRLGESAPGARDGLFADTNAGMGRGSLEPHTYVLCDVFGVRERQIILSNGEMAVPGTPILYYKANPASQVFDAAAPEQSIYNARDNAPLVGLGRLADAAKAGSMRRLHPLQDFELFYGSYARDPKVLARPWPYRPDSYFLISAGADGLYGTDDDIRNFAR